LQTIRRHPILILLTINILIGVFTFRDYGLSWDEPLFYDYANALGYAYSPREWFSGDFDLENAYGASGSDHANRGPAYLLLARQPVYLLESLGADRASAWHLVNFLAFQLGVYFLYRFALRWMKPWPAAASAALFSAQPLLWGHAFINPKDIPFLTFFLASVCLGFEMADQWADKTQNDKRGGGFVEAIMPALVLGFAASIRVLGPLAGLLVSIYALIRLKPRLYLFSRLLVYASLAVLVMFLTWPYLWENLLANFGRAFVFMSDNPTNLSVLFGGQVYRAGELPRRYLPFYLTMTLTEPVWLLFAAGFIVSIWKKAKRTLTNEQFITAILTLAWFVLLVIYAVLKRPAMYDGMRHFLFILPPVFVFAGLALDWLFEKIKLHWVSALLVSALLAPGIVNAIQLHPYQYAYYNSFKGGTRGVFRNYETEFWLTCYKEAVERFNETTNMPVNLYVKRESYIAAYYAGENVTVRDYRAESGEIESGDYILVNTRTNEDLKTYRDAPVVLEAGREGAVFCVIKEAP